ncbi:unnamed protein product [Urochloa decumbens]|uniref:Uncharacterized protein n=1 Tax=Urochloa decumbens TaxID=240449 RepID=A0ABC9B543_9POAL
MALLAASSKKTLLVPFLVFLVMVALLPTAVPACIPLSEGCGDNLCDTICAGMGSGSGQCRTERQTSICCCQPEASTNDTSVQHLV